MKALRKFLLKVLFWWAISVGGSFCFLFLLWQPWRGSPHSISVDTTVQFFGSIGAILFAFLSAMGAILWATYESLNTKMNHYQKQLWLRGVQNTGLEKFNQLVTTARGNVESAFDKIPAIKHLWRKRMFIQLPPIDTIGNQEVVESNLFYFRELQSWLPSQQINIDPAFIEYFRELAEYCDKVIDILLAVWFKNAQKILMNLKSRAETRVQRTIGFAMAEALFVLFFLGDPLFGHTLAFLSGIAAPKEIPSGVLGFYFGFIFIIGSLITSGLIKIFIEIYLVPQDLTC